MKDVRCIVRNDLSSTTRNVKSIHDSLGTISFLIAKTWNFYPKNMTHSENINIENA